MTSPSSSARRILQALIVAVAVLTASLTVGALGSPASAKNVHSTVSATVTLPSTATYSIKATLWRYDDNSGSYVYCAERTVTASGGTLQFSQDFGDLPGAYYALSFSDAGGNPYVLPTTWAGGWQAPTPGDATTNGPQPGPGYRAVRYIAPNASVTYPGTTIQAVLYGNGQLVGANSVPLSTTIVDSYYWWQGSWQFYARGTTGGDGYFGVPMRPGHSMTFVALTNSLQPIAYSGGSGFPAGPDSPGAFYYNTGGDVWVGTMTASGSSQVPGGCYCGGTGGTGGATGGGGSTGGGTTGGASYAPAPAARSYIQYRLTNAGLHPGQKARFKVKVSGPAGIPTGLVKLRTISGKLLAVANVKANGTAVLKSYPLPRANYYVRISYQPYHGNHVYKPSKTKKIFFCVD